MRKNGTIQLSNVNMKLDDLAKVRSSSRLEDIAFFTANGKNQVFICIVS